MNSKKLLPLFVFILLLTPIVTLAQFRPLVGIPGITDPNASFEVYINTLYAISISVAGLVAVIKIIIAGVKWMLSDLVSSKQEAKSDIQGALIGLLIIISAVLILEVINPQLTQSRLFLSPVDRPSGSGSGSTATAAPTSPLPTSSAPAGPVTEGDIDCVSSTDCTAAQAACTAAGGEVIPESGFWRDPSDITCKYGTSLPIACTGDLIGAGRYANVSCTAAQASCESNAGGIFTPPRQTYLISASCFTPVRPTVNRTTIN